MHFCLVILFVLKFFHLFIIFTLIYLENNDYYCGAFCIFEIIRRSVLSNIRNHNSWSRFEVWPQELTLKFGRKNLKIRINGSSWILFEGGQLLRPPAAYGSHKWEAEFFPASLGDAVTKNHAANHFANK